MKLVLEKASGRSRCRGFSCKQSPQFVSDTGRIKKDTTCVAISIASASGYTVSYFCRDCIDQLYLDMKKILNPQLWVLL